MGGMPSVAFLISGSDPNDPNATDTWVDVKDRLIRVRNAGRGRQYEIGQSVAGTLQSDMLNIDEYLNPANSSSPYINNAKLMRRIRWMCQYPAEPVTSADRIVYRQTTWQANGASTASATSIAAPSDLQVGDDVFIAVSLASSATVTVPPSGFTVVTGPTTNGTVLTSYIYHKVATAADINAGGWGGITFSTATTYSLACVAIDAVKGAVPTCQVIAASGSVAETVSQVNHTTPNVTTTLPQSVLLSVFVRSSNSASTWAAPPAGDTQLALVAGSAPSVNNAKLMVTVSPIVGPGTYSRTAATDSASLTDTMAIIALSVDNAVNLLPGQGIDPSFESYAAGTALSWILSVGSGVNPLVQTATAQQGTKCLQYAATAGTGTNGIGLAVNCIPGQQYTDTLYIRQTAANTNLLFINGGAAGTSTSTTGSYVRLQVTYTATQPQHQLWVTSSGTSLSGTVSIDCIQHEPGATATAFSTSGPKIRGVWGGHVSALPTTSDPDSQGYTGTAQLAGVGPLAALAQIGVKTDFVQMLASKKPDYWWPLADGSNATVFAEVSGNNGPPLRRMDANGGAPTFTPGTSVAIPGDPGTTGVTIAGGDPTVLNGPETVLATGLRDTPLAPVGWSSRPAGITLMLYLSHTDPRVFTENIYPILISDPQFANYIYLQFQGANSAAGTLTALILPFVGTNLMSTSHTDTWSDGKPHLAIITISVGTSTGHINLWVDGVQVAASGSISTSDWLNALTMGVVQIGGGINPNTSKNNPPLPDGVYSHFAIWNRELSNGDIADLWTAGQGYAGETTGQRLTRLLGQYYVGPTVIDTGRTTLVASGATDGTKLQQIAQRVTDSEAGLLKENRDGALEFDARDSRFQATVPQAVFGENVAGGEIPYRDTPVFGYDLTQVSNDATVTQTDGTKGTAADAASQKSYYQRSITIQTDTQSGLEAIDYANWLVANRKQPKQRIERITVDPGANPSIWPQVLDLEIGQRYTIIRRAKAANGGAGITMQADYFLEWIGHRNYDPEKGTWLVDLILTPAPLQPWILGDSTYGQLGITTVLGF